MNPNKPSKRIILGITGGIAAYKCGDLVRLLRKEGYDVHVVMSAGAQEFVKPLTFQALSGNPVHTKLFDLTEESEMGHIHLADTADLICVAPATANVIARMANGLCDDLLTTLLCVSRAKKLICPAMNVHMWENPLTQKNLNTLREHGFEILDPDTGSLACGYEGKGRLPDPSVISDRIASLLNPNRPLSGKRILVTAGPTREFLDPFRFISNPSTGKMGIALAKAACDLGGTVTLLLGPTPLSPPNGPSTLRFTSAEELLSLTTSHAKHADIVVMAAAVSDYTFPDKSTEKLKKTGNALELRLTPTEDILATLGKTSPRPFLIGFAAETHALESYAREKLSKKQCDVIVANAIGEPGAGFESDDNRVLLFLKEGLSSKGSDPITFGPSPKTLIARDIWQTLLPVLAKPS